MPSSINLDIIKSFGTESRSGTAIPEEVRPDEQMELGKRELDAIRPGGIGSVHSLSFLE